MVGVCAFINILSAGIYALYYYNARSSISINRLLSGLATLWVTLIVLGYGGVLFPEFRLHTPMSFIMPAGFMQNPLVRDYMLPPLAEVQHPWGAPKAYIRPSAPFPYTNSWGLAYTLLTPVMLACLLRLRSIWLRIALLIGMALSTVPAIATSNRGMFIGLGISAAYVLLRQFLAAHWRAVGMGVAAIVAVVVTLFASGTVDNILGRQDYSDSTGGRAALYRATWKATLESPDYWLRRSAYGTEHWCVNGYPGVPVDSDVLLRLRGSGAIRALHGVHCGKRRASEDHLRVLAT